MAKVDNAFHTTCIFVLIEGLVNNFVFFPNSKYFQIKSTYADG